MSNMNQYFRVSLVCTAYLLSYSGASAQKGPPIVDANVTNTSENPVPVVIQGGADGSTPVTVSIEPDAEVLPVEIQEPLSVEVQQPVIVQQSVEPIIRKLVRSVDCEQSACPRVDSDTIFVVPAGKNLFIDYITLLDRSNVDAPGGAPSQLYLRITNLDSSAFISGTHFIGRAGGDTFQDGNARNALGRSVPIAVGGAGEIVAEVRWFDTPFAGGLNYEVVLSGRLIDAD